MNVVQIKILSSTYLRTTNDSISFVHYVEHGLLNLGSPYDEAQLRAVFLLHTYLEGKRKQKANS